MVISNKVNVVVSKDKSKSRVFKAIEKEHTSNINKLKEELNTLFSEKDNLNTTIAELRAVETSATADVTEVNFKLGELSSSYSEKYKEEIKLIDEIDVLSKKKLELSTHINSLPFTSDKELTKFKDDVKAQTDKSVLSNELVKRNDRELQTLKSDILNTITLLESGKVDLERLKKLINDKSFEVSELDLKITKANESLVVIYNTKLAHERRVEEISSSNKVLLSTSTELENQIKSLSNVLKVKTDSVAGYDDLIAKQTALKQSISNMSEEVSKNKKLLTDTGSATTNLAKIEKDISIQANIKDNLINKNADILTEIYENELKAETLSGVELKIEAAVNALASIEKKTSISQKQYDNLSKLFAKEETELNFKKQQVLKLIMLNKRHLKTQEVAKFVKEIEDGSK